jgi:glycine dehydrogenase subunit 1
MFIPHTDNEREEMLLTIGLKKLEDMFVDIPKAYRFPKLDLPPALTEMEALSQAQELSLENESLQDLICFLGAGAYNHYIPAVVDFILHRGEFFTAYTPYQPEVSQGTLQVIFEYQSLISELTGMEASNASHYDGATAAAEAGLMAYHNFRGKRTKIILSPSLNPQYRETVRTYLNGFESINIFGDSQESDPFIDPNQLKNLVDNQVALVIIQYPDFYGRIIDFSELAKVVHEAGALLAVATNPIALGLLTPPGNMGADIVLGEGQPLGIPLSFGGPYLGFFATKKEYIRKISGRLVGETLDNLGRRGYVLTLTAREQHIRRDKATSNICSNQGLMALAATIYMSLLGKHGLRSVSELCYQKAHYAAKRISTIPGYSLAYSDQFYNEFAIKCPIPVDEINLHLLDHGILGGLDLSTNHPSLNNHMLIAVTEKNTKDDIDLLCEILQEVANV